MTESYVQPKDLEWMCLKCHLPLTTGTVFIEYLGHRFSTELPLCSRCGSVLISEGLALGKMTEVEQILEDK